MDCHWNDLLQINCLAPWDVDVSLIYNFQTHLVIDVLSIFCEMVFNNDKLTSIQVITSTNVDPVHFYMIICITKCWWIKCVKSGSIQS